jgi:hypothetical protein
LLQDDFWTRRFPHVPRNNYYDKVRSLPALGAPVTQGLRREVKRACRFLTLCCALAVSQEAGKVVYVVE